MGRLEECRRVFKEWLETVDEDTLLNAKPQSIYLCDFAKDLSVDRTVKEYISRLLRKEKESRREETLLSALTTFFAKHNNGVSIIAEVASLSREAGGIEKLSRDVEALAKHIRD
ncbi:MAG: hypothetical protein HQ567_12565 [Candidatus Nealsonbacteria bacterium]|nr:hypothetical protein [Candidatus Nealsonbacteria bacterium]